MTTPGKRTNGDDRSRCQSRLGFETGVRLRSLPAPLRRTHQIERVLRPYPFLLDFDPLAPEVSKRWLSESCSGQELPTDSAAIRNRPTYPHAHSVAFRRTGPIRRPPDSGKRLKGRFAIAPWGAPSGRFIITCNPGACLCRQRLRSQNSVSRSTVEIAAGSPLRSVIRWLCVLPSGPGN